MSKLWVFGDSYCLPNMVTHEWTCDPWHQVLSKMLGVNATEIHAQYGISNNYISYLIRQNLARIMPDDKLVIITTQINRQWFLKEYPHISNHNGVDSPLLTKNQQKALKNYILQLPQNDFDSMIIMENMIAWCTLNANILNVPVAIVAGFEAISYHTSTGSLFQVDWKEHGSFERKQMFLDKHNKRDPKDCHLHKDNHIILAEKLYDYFKHQKPIDLSTGFRENIIF